MLLGELTSIYDIHRWARYTMWLGLLSMALLLTWLSRGFPPSAWRLFGATIQCLPQLWEMRGPGVMVSLMGLGMISLLWLLAWCLLLWTSFGLFLHHHRWRQREHQMASRLSSRPAAPLPRATPTHKEQPLWTIPMPLAGPMDDPHGSEQSRGGQLEDSSGEYTCDDVIEYTIPIPLLRLPQPPPSATHPLRVPQGPRTTLSVPPGPTSTRPAIPPIAVSSPTAGRAHPLEVGIGWHVGKTRRNRPNEDSVAVLQGTCTCQGRLVPFGLFIVADGMGGHADGQQASRIAIQTMMKTVVQDVAGSGRLWTTDGPDDEPFVRTLVRGVEQAHLTICQLNQERHEDMGTTVTAVLICDAHATIVNVGDSRTYLYRQREGLWQITQDHSLVASLVVNGEITPDEVYTHPQRHQVYRSLGMDGRFIVDWFITDVYTGDRFLLCSDGLWEMVRDSAIADILGRTADVRVVSEQLVQAALAGGGADNISVVVVQVG